MCGTDSGGLVVGAGRESAARAGEDDDADVVVVGDLFDDAPERNHHFERH